MYKKRSKFIQGIRKGSLEDFAIYVDPLITKKRYRAKKKIKLSVFSLPLGDLRNYSNLISIACKKCSHENTIKIDNLIKRFGSSVKLKDIKKNFYCSNCFSRDFNLNVSIQEN